MRCLILAFGLLFGGCGVIHQVASCDGVDRNVLVCPAPQPGATQAKTTPPCHKAVGMKVVAGRVTRFLARSQGLCVEERKVIQERLKHLPAGIKCQWEENRVKCGSLGWAAWLFTLLVSRRKNKEEWYGVIEAIGVRELRDAIWHLEDWSHHLSNWVERPIEAWMAVVAFTPFGLLLSLASAWLGRKGYGWASMAALLLSVCLYGSGLEWGLFLVKVTISFFTETNQGEDLLARYLKWRWLRSVS